jgi:hypothetical protein
MALAVAKDLSIIFLALESIVVLVFLAILIVQVTRLVRLLREEVMPILGATQETVGAVRGTASFMGDRVVQPVVQVASYTAGAGQVIRTLFGGQRRNGQTANTQEGEPNHE